MQQAVPPAATSSGPSDIQPVRARRRALARADGRRARTTLPLGPNTAGLPLLRLHAPLRFPAPAGGLLNLGHSRSRQWALAIEASGTRKPARIYDLRSTFASRTHAAGVPVFELANVMGTSVRMIERHYGTLLDGAGASMVGRLDAYDADEGHERAVDQR